MVNEIIPMYPDFKDEYLEAAKTWRLPFWDWAKNPKVPSLVRCHRIKLKIGVADVGIENPLHIFRMPNGEKMKAYGVGSIIDFWGARSVDVSATVNIIYIEYFTNVVSFLVRRVHCNQPLSS
jgi:hypothetical protein